MKVEAMGKRRKERGYMNLSFWRYLDLSRNIPKMGKSTFRKLEMSIFSGVYYNLFPKWEKSELLNTHFGEILPLWEIPILASRLEKGKEEENEKQKF